MKVYAIDLELNQQPTGAKIIQIGVSIGDVNTKEILESKSFYVNPNEEITPYINKLTGITQAQVANADPLPIVHSAMVYYLKSQSVQGMPITWGIGDVYAIKKELAEYGIKDEFFGYRSMDIKTVVQAIKQARGQGAQGGLAKSMLSFGLRFNGQKHDAKYDAENTLRFYFKLLDLLRNVR